MYIYIYIHIIHIYIYIYILTHPRADGRRAEGRSLAPAGAAQVDGYSAEGRAVGGGCSGWGQYYIVKLPII